MSLKLGTQSIRNIATFEEITSVHPRDCIVKEDCIYFLVDPENIGIAIGRNGKVIRELRRVFGKTVRVLGYHDSPEAFIRNALPAVKSIDLKSSGVTVTVEEEDKVSVIGKNGRNIKAIREILERHFAIKNLRVK